jgi:uncharacterized membrane protein YkgB
MAFQTLRGVFDRIDLRVTELMARNGIMLLRISIGVVFLWFGALKLVPGLSPAEEMIRATLGFLPLDLFIPLLALWEMLIGIGLISGRFMRATILLLLLQMPGTLSPILLAPELVFTIFPLGLTLAGQYIVKNAVLISAALVIGATVRGGRLVHSPEMLERVDN